MTVINEWNHEVYDEEELRKMASDKLMFRPRLRDARGVTYKFEKSYPHHVLMSTDLGFHRCFRYSEVWYAMY